MIPAVRRPLAAAAVLTLALVLAGCGGDDSDPSAGASPSGSASASPGAGSPGVAGSESPSSTATSATPAPTPASSGPEPVSGAQLASIVDEALDDTSAAHLVVDNGLGFLSGEGDVDFRETPSSLAMTLTSDETGDEQAVVLLVVGTTLYLQDGPGGFLSVDVDSPTNPFGSSLTDQLDPRTVMYVVQQHLTRATHRGSIEQDGQELQVYRAVADGPAVAAALAPDLASQQRAAVPASVNCDLTIDPDGHASTITVDLGADNGQIVYTLSDWRTDVAIDAPPAAQVSDLPDLG